MSAEAWGVVWAVESGTAAVGAWVSARAVARAAATVFVKDEKSASASDSMKETRSGLRCGIQNYIKIVFFF